MTRFNITEMDSKYQWSGGDWCQRCWIEFTTLTEQERLNMETAKRVNKFKRTLDDRFSGKI